jgi:NAD(P)-dependent dehydrogenase (short-subunit alcohol dehydrogenase family)
MTMEEKTVLVTGANRGIGKALPRRQTGLRGHPAAVGES